MSIPSISADDLTVAGRYLAGQLPPQEQALFEAQLRQDPAMARTLEATARLKVGLATLRERGELDELLAPPVWSFQRRMALAIAASVLIAALAVMLMRPTVEHSSRPVLAATISSLADPRGSALAVTASLAVFRKRSETYDAVIESSPSVGAVQLRVLPETVVASGHYRVSLARFADSGSLTLVASVDDLRPADDGFVTTFIDTSQLTAGRYRLDVAGKVPAGEVAASDTFLLRVISGR